jgi:hypothetical protein
MIEGAKAEGHPGRVLDRPGHPRDAGVADAVSIKPLPGAQLLVETALRNWTYGWGGLEPLCTRAPIHDPTPDSRTRL